MTTSQGERGYGPRTPYEEYSGYKVYDENQEKIGKVDDLFVDEYDRPEYMGVKMGFLGTSSTLIPMEVVRVNDERQLIQVYAGKDKIKDGPAFDHDQEIDADYEKRVREHYGLGESPDASERGAYGSYYSGSSYDSSESGTDDSGVDIEYGERTEGGYGEQDRFLSGDEVYDQDRGYTGAAAGYGGSGSAAGSDRGSSVDQSGDVGPGMSMGDREGGEFVEHASDNEGVRQQGSDLEDEDELRVQRSEEELRAGTREREAGKVNVRKRVRTEREQKTVPTRHEEVTVERVPASGEASETEIGEQDVSMPVTEDEVVTEKKAVKKEEIRVNKEAVESSETVEEDVRKEEVDVDDETERGSGLDR